MGWVFHTIGIRELLGQSVKSREGKRTWLSTWKAGRTMMGVGEGGGDRKPGQKEGSVPQTERGQTLKKGVDNHAQSSLEGHLPCCTRHSGSRQPHAQRGRQGEQICGSRSIIFNLLADFVGAQQHFLLETKLKAARGLGVAPAALIAE